VLHEHKFVPDLTATFSYDHIPMLQLELSARSERGFLSLDLKSAAE
jgi:hypothetical protein